MNKPRLVRKKEVEGCNHFMCNADRCDYYECIGCEYFDMMLSKLYHYECLEEQGRLIELPCKVGDTVWMITEGQYKTRYYVYPVVVDWIKQTQYTTSFGRWGSGMLKDITFHIDDFGKTAFLTKEEAEAKLAELKEGAN